MGADMRKEIIGIVLVLVVLTAGCAGSMSSPSKTVENFASDFEKGNYDKCYDMMSSHYKKYYDFSFFVSNCKSADPDRYELIEITNEYIYENEAVVEVKANKTSSSDFSSLLDSLFEGTPESGVITKQIELVKEENEWKITKFPDVLT